VTLVADAEQIGPARCDGCQARIVWARVHGCADGRSLPVDLDPEGGPLELFAEVFPDGTAVDGVQWVRQRPDDRPAGSPGWWPHWATCRGCW
jgi:hypothetical protein